MFEVLIVFRLKGTLKKIFHNCFYFLFNWLNQLTTLNNQVYCVCQQDKLDRFYKLHNCHHICCIVHHNSIAFGQNASISKTSDDSIRSVPECHVLWIALANLIFYPSDWLFGKSLLRVFSSISTLACQENRLHIPWNIFWLHRILWNGSQNLIEYKYIHCFRKHSPCLSFL